MARVYTDGTLTHVVVYTLAASSNEQLDCSGDFIQISAAACYAVNPTLAVNVTHTATSVTIDPGGSSHNVPCILIVVGTGLIPS